MSNIILTDQFFIDQVTVMVSAFYDVCYNMQLTPEQADKLAKDYVIKALNEIKIKNLQCKKELLQ